MKFLKKFIVGSLVVALVSFAGSFCVHPMAVQAASMDMAMGVSLVGLDANEGGCISESSSEISNTVTCVSDCVTKTPQATATKKTNADSALSVLVIILQTEQLQFSKLFSDPLDVTGVSPPSPDILSTVVKIE